MKRNVLYQNPQNNNDELVERMTTFVTDHKMSLDKFDEIYTLARQELCKSLFAYETVEEPDYR